MKSFPNLHLIHLRQIGWDEWDPIGIRQLNDHDWRQGAADEYDCYLLHVADLLESGAVVAEAAEYLDKIASEHMGLGPFTETGHIASVKTVEAIYGYLRTLTKVPSKVR